MVKVSCRRAGMLALQPPLRRLSGLYRKSRRPAASQDGCPTRSPPLPASGIVPAFLVRVPVASSQILRACTLPCTCGRHPTERRDCRLQAVASIWPRTSAFHTMVRSGAMPSTELYCGTPGASEHRTWQVCLPACGRRGESAPARHIPDRAAVHDFGVASKRELGA
jgi:hypothetical protein